MILRKQKDFKNLEKCEVSECLENCVQVKRHLRGAERSTALSLLGTIISRPN